MSNFFVQIAQDGRVQRWSSSPIGEDDLFLPIELSPLKHYYDGKSWQPLPARPSREHAFNPLLGEWFDPRDLSVQLAQARKDSMMKISQLIGQVRERYITVIPGQEMIYSAKEAEAKDFLAADPVLVDLSEYPMISAEIGITADTAYELAQVWMNMSVMWRNLSAHLEKIRLGAISRIEKATTLQEIDLVITDLETALSVIS